MQLEAFLYGEQIDMLNEVESEAEYLVQNFKDLISTL